MSQGTATEYNVINNRMDQLDILTLCSPAETPFFTSAPKYRKVRSDIFEYYADNIDAVSLDTIGDGQDVVTFDNKAKNRSVIQQRVQIQYQSWKVSRGQQEDADPAGVSDEVGRSKMLATLALKRNVEAALCSDQEAIWTGEEKGNKFRGLGAFIDETNKNIPENVRLSANGKQTTTNITETAFRKVLQAAYEGTGNANAKFRLFAMPELQNAITNFSRFNSESNNILQAQLLTSSSEVKCSVRIYNSDWGIVAVVPTLFAGYQANGGAPANNTRGYLINMDYVAVSLNKNLWSEEYNDNGGGRRGAVWFKGTLINKCPKAMGKFI